MEAVFIVARPGAIAILADCFVAAIAFLMFLLFVVVRMATGTVRLKRCVLPKDQPCTRQMTVRTRLVAAVIERLIRQASVRENIGYPRGSHMAHVALLRRYEMSGVLTGGGYTIVT